MLIGSVLSGVFSGDDEMGSIVTVVVMGVVDKGSEMGEL